MLVTIYTPTYNRADTLVRTYHSLLNQTSSNFQWLIVDDGSTDNTEELVKEWQSTAPFRIDYLKKENGGLHTGYNMAIANINTELCMNCDSDDYLADNVIEIIETVWSQHRSENLAGIIGLDYIAGTDMPIGGFFRDISKPLHFLELKPKLNHMGDFKMVHRTSLLKPHVPMPTMDKEKNFNPIYIFMKIDPHLNYILINENLCNVDYQPNGMSNNILFQFRNSPRSFAELRKLKLGHPKVGLWRKMLDAAHLVSSVLIARDLKVFQGTPNRWMCYLTAPLGLCIYSYIMFKTSKR